MKTGKKTKKERARDALHRSAYWLARGNQYAENGEAEEAERCYGISAQWLMKSNKLEESNEITQPQEDR